MSNTMRTRALPLMLVVVMALCALMFAGCSSGPSVENLIRDDLTSQFDELKNLDEDFMDEMASEMGEDFSTLGIDGTDWAKSWLDGFDYKIGDITVDEEAGTATAQVKVTCKSASDILSGYSDAYAEQLSAAIADGSVTDEAGAYELAGKLLMDATAQAEPKDTDIEFTYQRNDDNEWEATEDAEQELTNALM